MRGSTLLSSNVVIAVFLAEWFASLDRLLDCIKSVATDDMGQFFKAHVALLKNSPIRFLPNAMDGRSTTLLHLNGYVPLES